MSSARLYRRLLTLLVGLGLVLGAHSLALGGALFLPLPEWRGDRELVGVEGVERFRFVSVDLSQLGLAGGRFRPVTVGERATAITSCGAMMIRTASASAREAWGTSRPPGPPTPTTGR